MRISVGLVLLLLALVWFLGVTAWLNVGIRNEQQFAFLARSFLHGNLDLIGPALSNLADTSPHHGKYYWPLGPLPAVMLMPFELAATACGTFFYQGYLQPFLVFALMAIIFRIARRTGYDAEDGGYLAFGFAFATAFLGVGLWPWSWYFSQVITCVLVFAAIAEMIGRRRPLVLGILFALALATRATAALGVVWCIGEVLCTRSTWRNKLLSLVAIGFPCLVVLLLLLLYNYARFGNVLDQGYVEQIVPPHGATARAMGIFSLRHLPGNLYYLLLAAPTPVRYNNESIVLAFPFVKANPWGMSLFVTSPCFLYMFGLQYRDTTSRLLLLTVIVIALPILFYYGVGYRQFGYRYSLDFMPLLYFLLLRNYRQQRGNLPAVFKAVLLVSALWNLYLFFTAVPQSFLAL
ncbi:MAG TPA: hypothetical protein VI298_07405 [Geobacteraceae bacterium]